MEQVIDRRTQLAPSPQFPVKPLDMGKIKDGILVRVPNWLGDAIMTLPALMQLKKMLPAHCGLFVLCPSSLKELFEDIPIVNMTIALSDVHRKWSPKDIRIISKLNAGAGILFNNSLRDALYLRRCGVSPLYGAAARCRGILLKRSFKFPERRNFELNQLHHANKYLSIVKALGADDWDGTLPEFIPKVPIEQINQEILELCEHSRLMTIAAGAAYGGSKRWESGKFNAVAGWWIKEGGVVAVLGSGKEVEIGNKVVTGLPENKIFNFAGKTDMSELIFLLKNSRVCVANDSGIMHLSGALGKSGVAIFGPTDWSSTGPIAGNWKIVHEKQPCGPCFKRECPQQNNKCMQAVTPKTVIEKVQEILDEN